MRGVGTQYRAISRYENPTPRLLRGKLQLIAITAGTEEVRTRTAEAQNFKNTTLALLGEVIFIFGVKRLDVLEYKHIKEERSRTGLQEVALQVKVVDNMELNNFVQYLKHEYAQIREQTRNKRQLAAEAKAGLDQRSMHETVLAAEALLSSNHAQLQAFKAVAANKEQSNIQNKLSKYGATIKRGNISKTAQLLVPFRFWFNFRFPLSPDDRAGT